MWHYRRSLVPRARELRSGSTACERKLWRYLRRRQVRGAHFYRQRPIGQFIVDFYCPSARLVVEIDGPIHRARGHAAQDRERDRYLLACGLLVVRFTNDEIDAAAERVVDQIAALVEERS